MADYVFKFIVIGNSNIGKTCMISRFVDGKYNPNYGITIGVDFSSKIININIPDTSNSVSEATRNPINDPINDTTRDTVGDTLLANTYNANIWVPNGTNVGTNVGVKLNIFDTAGLENFKSVTKSYYTGSAGVILCYDISDRSSFDQIQTWVNEIKMYCSTNIKIMLVGTKSDVNRKPTSVTTIEGQQFANLHGYDFIETSAKHNINVKECFHNLAKSIYNDIHKNNATYVGAIKLIPLNISQLKKTQSNSPLANTYKCCTIL